MITVEQLKHTIIEQQHAMQELRVRLVQVEAEHARWKRAGMPHVAQECDVCACLFIPGGLGGETTCGTCLKQRLDRAESRVKELELDKDILESALRPAPAPCGHASQYCYTEDGGKHIVCLLCEYKKRENAVAEVKLHQAYLSERAAQINRLETFITDRLSHCVSHDWVVGALRKNTPAEELLEKENADLRMRCTQLKGVLVSLLAGCVAADLNGNLPDTIDKELLFNAGKVVRDK